MSTNTPAPRDIPQAQQEGLPGDDRATTATGKFHSPAILIKAASLWLVTMCNLTLITGKGGNPELVKASQKKRGGDKAAELVDEVLELYTSWTKVGFQLKEARTQANVIKKQIGEAKKAKKEPEPELWKSKEELDTRIKQLEKDESDAENLLKVRASGIGNLVHESVRVSMSEDENVILKTWSPEPNEGLTKRADLLSHDAVMHRLDMVDLERGAKVAGHRGFFLINEGVDLNQALINYGLDFLRQRGFRKTMAPFMMRKPLMAKTAQLEEFDEALYRLSGDGEDDKYLIATSEQPLSAYHSDEWFEKPKEQLPLRYAGYSTCFRKEAGSHGRDTWGIFRVHQFEKVEQFCITEPSKSWEMFEEMLENSEAFYRSLGIGYRLVGIVSGALNNAAAKKADLEAWFPSMGEFKELVSVSNCTDYQSRSLEVRCGVKKQGDTQKVYVHMLNGTLCATERALCCLVENYQTPEGLVIPTVLRPYMQGREFLPFVKEAPKKKK
ncbi:serine--tRNA ligase [Puccinia sorghi]|uniref:serine--tRNA ligase n=1 Tax=Puccinia sorghi TaxID=27349 RepID=A0A0L6VG48_9BASI|nr:serine--tRNA ligase [Puccinia sorghi]